MYLLDTNILIGFLKNDEKLIEFLDELTQENFAISIISRFEVLIGAGREQHSPKEIKGYLDVLEIMEVTTKITDAALEIIAIHPKLKFKDVLIAATAQIHKKTLITYDKDFQKIQGINVIYPPLFNVALSATKMVL